LTHVPLLRRREFRALLVLRLTFALTGSAFATVVAFHIYELTHDPLALGLLGLVEAIPALSLMLLGGHVADRYDRRSIVVLTSVTATLAAMVLAILTAVSLVTSLAILGVIFIAGFARGFERPALSAFEAQVIPHREAARAASWVSSASEFGSIVGPAIGGIAIAVAGLSATYALIAAILVVSTASILLIARKPMPERVEGERMIESLLSGINYVRRSPALLGSMALDLFAVFFGGAIALLPIFATDVLHVGPAGLGILRAAPSVGALLVMLVATRWPPTRHAGRTMLISVTGFGLSMIVFGLSSNFLLSLVALFVSGAADGVSVIIRYTILRVLSPERVRGRVAAVNWVFIGASNELGAFESGIAARLFGTVPSVVGGGLLTLAIVGLVALTVPTLRGLDLGTARPMDEV
jgi:MFS family permease